MRGSRDRKLVLSIVEYTRYSVLQMLLAHGGQMLFVLGVVGGISAVLTIDAICLLWLFSWLVPSAGAELPIAGSICGCGSGGLLFFLLLLMGKRLMSSADQMKPCFLVSRHTADQLPIEESLLRPSSEPQEHFKGVLLRASLPRQEYACDHLLLRSQRAARHSHSVPFSE